MKLFNYDSPFWSFMSRLADLIILNLLWIVFCIPVAVSYTHLDVYKRQATNSGRR